MNVVITKILGSVRKSDNELGAKNKKIEGNSDLWGQQIRIIN